MPFLTEFGATDDLETIERIVRLADDHMVSWQYWHYCDCDDPTTSGPGVQAVVVDAAQPPRGDNVKREKLEVLARPYPRAVAGTPRSFGFDPATKRFDLVYSTRAPGRPGARAAAAARPADRGLPPADPVSGRLRGRGQRRRGRLGARRPRPASSSAGRNDDRHRRA